MSSRLVRRDVVDSTNEVAKNLVAEGTPPWTVVVANKQVEGRGRFGRRWVSPRGGLYVSVAVREDLDRLPIISLSAGLAVVDVLRELSLESTLKWPNDVLIRGAKVAGILVEGLVGPDAYWGILGIGINSNVPLERLPPEFAGRTTTLRHELSEEVDNELLLETLLSLLQRGYPAPGEEDRIVARYRGVCSTLGRWVKVETSQGILEGRAVDISPTGFLLLEAKEVTVEVSEGIILMEA